MKWQDYIIIICLVAIVALVISKKHITFQVFINDMEAACEANVDCK